MFLSSHFAPQFVDSKCFVTNECIITLTYSDDINFYYNFVATVFRKRNSTTYLKQNPTKNQYQFPPYYWRSFCRFSWISNKRIKLHIGCMGWICCLTMHARIKIISAAMIYLYVEAKQRAWNVYYIIINSIFYTTAV